MNSSFVTDDGTELHVNVAGEGIPFVFQHGLCGDAGQTAEAFPPEPGYQRITIETFANDVAAYIEANLNAPVIVGGISLGAAISLRLAVKRPDLVRALVLARPAWLVSSAPKNMLPNAEVGELLTRLPPPEARTTFLAGQIGMQLAAEAPDNLASLSGFFARDPIHVTAALLTAISGDGPGVTEADLASLACPTLVLGHEGDLIHPVDYARVLAHSIPTARFVQITPKVASKAQYLADFHQAMRTFLKEL